MSNAPKLWVWAGSPDDKLDVLRYVSATDADILNQPVVAELREENEQLQKRFDAAAAEVTKIGESQFGDLLTVFGLEIRSKDPDAVDQLFGLDPADAAMALPLALMASRKGGKQDG